MRIQSSHSLVIANKGLLVMGSTALVNNMLFSVFISHVIKTKNRNRSINKFKNLGYDR